MYFICKRLEMVKIKSNKHTNNIFYTVLPTELANHKPLWRARSGSPKGLTSIYSHLAMGKFFRRMVYYFNKFHKTSNVYGCPNSGQ